MEFTFRMADVSIRGGQGTFSLRRSEVEEHLKQVGVVRPDRAYQALSLKPRARWDDPKPKNAKPRDWYPWRFNRRLSLMRRALVQLDDPLIHASSSPRLCLTDLLSILSRAIPDVCPWTSSRAQACERGLAQPSIRRGMNSTMLLQRDSKNWVWKRNQM